VIGLQTLNPLIGRIFSAVPGGGQIERNCGWSSFWILHNGGIIDQKGIGAVGLVVDVNLVALSFSRLLSCHCLDFGRITSFVLVVG
jgi:hypothetical protein